MKVIDLLKFAMDGRISKEQLAAIADSAFLQKQTQAIDAGEKADNGWRTTEQGKHYKINPKSGQIVAGNIGVAKPGDKVDPSKKTGKAQAKRAAAAAKKQSEKMHSSSGYGGASASKKVAGTFNTNKSNTDYPTHQTAHQKHKSANERFKESRNSKQTQAILSGMSSGSSVKIGSYNWQKGKSGWSNGTSNKTDAQMAQLMHSGINRNRMQITQAGASSPDVNASAKKSMQRSVENSSVRGAAISMDKYKPGTTLTFTDKGKKYTYTKQPDKNGMPGAWLQNGTKNGFAVSSDIASAIIRNGGDFDVDWDKAGSPGGSLNMGASKSKSNPYDVNVKPMRFGQVFVQKPSEKAPQKTWDPQNGEWGHGVLRNPMHEELSSGRKVYRFGKRQYQNPYQFKGKKKFGDF